MPFFFSKFSPKKIPPRKTESSIISKEFGSDFAAKELGLNNPAIKLQLGENKLIYEDGEWLQTSGINGNTHQELNKFKKNNKILEEENNMLKLKLEIILDMLTQTTLESQKQCKEIEQLRQELKKLKD